MTPRASFVIPAYNADRWISKSIWSCRNQIIKQIEIIVVNDGSTDMTRDIIDKHAEKDPRVIPIHLDSNRGQSHCRNTGNERATADYIFVLDADDMAARTRAKDCLAAFSLKKADIVYGGWFRMDSFGTVLEKVNVVPFDPERNRRDKTNHLCHSTMAYRKEVASRISYRFEEYKDLGIDDWRFTWDAYKAGFKFYPMKQYLSYYRSLDGSMTKVRDNEKTNEIKEQYLATL